MTTHRAIGVFGAGPVAQAVTDKAIRHGRRTSGIVNRRVVYTRGGLPADVLTVIEEPAPEGLVARILASIDVVAR